MNELYKILYEYAGEYQADRYLQQEQDALADNERMCAAVITELNEVLSPPWQRRLEEYIYGRDAREGARCEAYFCSGLAMGLYLGGLGGALMG